MWTVMPTDQFSRDLKWYDKKHPNELAACLANLDKYLYLLAQSKNSKCVEAGYLHPEGKGVVALDQSGSGKKLAQTRLYTFPDDNAKIVHLITIGNKQEQPADVKRSHAFVKSIT